MDDYFFFFPKVRPMSESVESCFDFEDVNVEWRIERLFCVRKRAGERLCDGEIRYVGLSLKRRSNGFCDIEFF